jgi:hypothetical protein
MEIGSGTLRGVVAGREGVSGGMEDVLWGNLAGRGQSGGLVPRHASGLGFGRDEGKSDCNRGKRVVGDCRDQRGGVLRQHTVHRKWRRAKGER